MISAFFTATVPRVSVFMKSGWLYFPGILFLLLGTFAALLVPQGQDLLTAQLEHPVSNSYFMIGLLFWSNVTWYSSRLVTNQKTITNHISSAWYFFVPRLLGFTCYSIMAVSFLTIQPVKIIETHTALVLILLSMLWYYVFEKITDGPRFGNFLQRFVRLRYLAIALLLLILLPVCICTNKLSYTTKACIMFCEVVMMQQIYALFIKKRRLLLQNSGGFNVVLKFIPVLKGERIILRLFNAISTIALVIYFAAILSIDFARALGTWPFVLLAFGVLLGFGNLITILSVRTKVNLHLFFVGLGFAVGFFSEPYTVKMLEEQKTQTLPYHQRMNTEEYFENWMNSKKILNDTNVKEFPVYIVLSDGGASRAGYWVSSVLAKIQDESEGEFGKHLLCMSGASGGSFGNAIFYSQLYTNSKESFNKKSDYYAASQNFCRQDYLTYALAHMLGPDYFRHLFPFSPVSDRSAALEYSMEHPDKTEKGFPDFSCSFSDLIGGKQKKNAELPVLFINSTCMQNGNPALISTIDVSDPRYNGRMDVLDLVDSMTLKDKKTNFELKLSNAVVLGARFPYVSPAGKIDNYYFVDGGYFDNSGSGAVMEMLSILKEKFKNDARFLKLRFNILHITNSAPAKAVKNKVHPLINDLAAPAKTLIGAYGQQTEINDKRLKGYLKRELRDKSVWLDISLYNESEKEEDDYSMNWFISDYNLKRMDARLNSVEEIKGIVKRLNDAISPD